MHAWSLEGDELHLVDCVVLGPYAAADMHAWIRWLIFLLFLSLLVSPD